MWWRSMKKLVIANLLVCLVIACSVGAETKFTHLPKDILEEISLEVSEIKPSQVMIDKVLKALQPISDEEAAPELLKFSKEMGNVLKGIKSLGMANKKLYRIVNDLENTNYYIRAIASNWGVKLLPVAIGLGTPGAKIWIQRYIATPEGAQEARDLLFTSVAGGQQYKPFIYALVQAGFKINVADKTGKPILNFAMEKEDLEMIDYLIKHGAKKLIRYK